VTKPKTATSCLITNNDFTDTHTNTAVESQCIHTTDRYKHLTWEIKTTKLQRTPLQRVIDT